jgi:VWFA-related protein
VRESRVDRAAPPGLRESEKTMNRLVRLSALLLIVAGMSLSAQEPPPAATASQPPTFKVEVNYVEVDAVVTDQQGNFVRGLAKDDFQVLEDGKPQSIATFSIVDIPIERQERPLFAKAPIEPDVKSNAKPFDGRIYVMMLDDLHTLPQRSQRVKAAARKFIEQNLGANDLMAVVHISGRTEAGQEFTSSKRLLLAAVDKFMGRKIQSATAGRIDQYYNTQGIRQQGEKIDDPLDAERGFDARNTLSALKNVSDWFAGIHGRKKSILFVSEGIDYDINNVFDNPQASTLLEDTREAIRAATKANVSIYGIDPRGLTDLGDETIEVQSFPDDTSLGLDSRAFQNELRLSQDSLRVLADETGGFASVNRNDFTTAFQRVVKDNSSYYVLAYYPPSDKRDGKFHNITVRVTRPGLAVRARKGYAAPKGKAPAATPAVAKGASAEVREALNSPLPLSGLTLNIFAAPFKGTAPNASVLLGTELRGRDLKLTDGDKVEVSYFAIDAQGKIRAGNTDSVTLNLKPDTKSRIAQSGIRLLNRMEMPPGRYQLRVAARDASGGNVGSVLYDLDVPDFLKPALSVSGIVLTSAIGSLQPTAHPDEQLRPVLPGPPVGMRQFPQNDVVVVYAEVYDNEGSSPHKVDITTSVTSDEGKVMFKTDEQRESSEIQGKRGGYGFTARVPMKDLAPGLYVLTVEGKSRLGNMPTASRQIQFTVVPPVAPTQ